MGASWAPANATSQALVQHLDEMQTDASPWWKDKAHTGDDRILSGGPGLQRGRIMTFNGTTQYGTVGHDASLNLSGTDAFSWAFIYKVGGSSNYLLDKQQATAKGYYIKQSGSANLIVSIPDGVGWNETTLTAGLSSGTEYHIVITYDSDKLRLYVNGTLTDTSASIGAGTLADSTTDLNFARYSGGSSYTNSSLAGFHFYNDVLTADEAAWLFNRQSGTDPGTANLIGRWLMDEQSGTTFYDSSGNSLDGTWFNTPTHGTQDIWSWQNSDGYYLSGSVFVPRDESNTAQDVLGNTLTYSGSAPRHGKIVDSNCATLNGSTQYGSVAHHADLNLGGAGDIYSIFARVKTSNTGTQAVIIKDSNVTGPYPFYVYINATTGLVDGFTEDSTSYDYVRSTTAVNDGAWHSILFVVDKTAAELKLYIDGSQEGGTVSITNNGDFSNSEVVQIGRANSTYYFNGDICDVRIFQSDQSANAVSLHNAETAPTAVVWYPMAEGSGSTFHNVTENQHHGTWVNSPTLTTDQDVFAYNVTMGCTVSGAVLVPALSDGSTDADGNSIGVPSGGFDDRCESNLDHDPFTCPLLAPGNLNSYDMNTDYSSAYRMKIDDLTSVDQHFAKRDTTTPSRNDEHILYAGDLSGDDWDNIHVYVDTRAQLNGRLEHVWTFNVITLGSPNTFLDEVGSLTLSDSDDNAVTGLAGKLGNCIEMTLTGGSLADSVGLDATAPAGLNTNLPITHYGWIKVGNLSSSDDIRIFDQNSSSQKLEITASNGYLKWTYNGSTITGSAVGDGNWYFFAAARDDDGNLTLWIDGVRQGIQAGVSMPTGTGTILHYEDSDDVSGEYPQHLWDAWGATGTYKLRDNHVSFLHNLGSGRALNTTSNEYDA